MYSIEFSFVFPSFILTTIYIKSNHHKTWRTSSAQYILLIVFVPFITLCFFVFSSVRRLRAFSESTWEWPIIHQDLGRGEIGTPLHPMFFFIPEHFPMFFVIGEIIDVVDLNMFLALPPCWDYFIVSND